MRNLNKFSLEAHERAVMQVQKHYREYPPHSVLRRKLTKALCLEGT